MERELFGNHRRSMSRLMDSFFSPDFGFPQLTNHFGSSNSLSPFSPASSFPFGHMGGGGLGLFNSFPSFPNMNSMLSQMGEPSGNSLSFSSTSVMSVSAGPDGRPQVYHASSATRQGPGGVKEVRRTLADSRTGTKKLTVGRHIGERGHVREREENVVTGRREESEDFINLGEEEVRDFHADWRDRVYGNSSNISPHLAIGGSSSSGGHASSSHPAYTHHHNRNSSKNVVSSASGVTIEELSGSDDETSSPPPPVAPIISTPLRKQQRRTTTTTTAPSSKKQTSSSSKRSKKY